MNVTDLTEGDVLRYTSERTNRWCREGVAIVHRGRDGQLHAVDTYWGHSSPEDHVLTDGELATATVTFNLADYDQVERPLYPPFDEYAPQDRQVVPSQHGLRLTKYLRKGARPSGAEKVRKHVHKLREARHELERAQSRVEWAQRDLEAAFAARGGTK